MKTIRSLMTLAGLSLVLFALGVTGAKAQVVRGLSTINFAGSFTLPNDAQWGTMALPAGDYTLYYGNLYGSYFVEVRGTAKGSPHGVIFVAGNDQSSATKNQLICVREGNGLIVRALEMPQIGTAAEFALPRGARLTVHRGNHKGYTQLAEAPMLIQRVTVRMNEK
jgi:hypothetical protein